MALRYFQSLVAPHSPLNDISPLIEVDLYGKWQTLSPTPPLIEVLLYVNFKYNENKFSSIRLQSPKIK